jgi:pimeloyl-ACP methyl ester carboxylesterase
MADPVVLLLPGMTLNSTAMPALSASTLAVDFNQLSVGPAGEGAKRPGMALYAGRLEEVLRHEPEWRSLPRIVVAHSFGGMLALSWLLAPQNAALARIDGLVLIATTAGPMFDALHLKVAFPFGRGRRIGLKPFMAFWNRRWITRLAKLVLGRGHDDVGRVDFGSLRRQSDLSLDLAGWRNTDWRAMRSYRFAMDGFDVRDRLDALDASTIVLHGTDDSLFPVDVAEDLTRRIRGAELRVIEGAGHGLPVTHGAAVVEAVEDLLARYRRSEQP